MTASPSMSDAESPAFSEADSAVFDQTEAGAAWTDLNSADQERFRSIRGRLKQLAQRLVAPATRAAVPMVPFVSTLNPNGRVPGELWSCVFPQAVGNKSYALQVAVIINSTGAEISCCLGAGTSQTRAPEAVREHQEAWEKLRHRLADVPAAMQQTLEANLGDTWQLRKSWLLEPGQRDFSTLGDWLAFAASDAGSGASISHNLTPQALEEAGQDLVNELLHDLETFAPLFTHVYALSAETTIGRSPLTSAFRGRVSRERPPRTTKPARETISCRPAATSPRSSLVSPALLPRPPKSPHIQRENGGEPRSDPGVRAPTRLGGGGRSPERTRLVANVPPHVVGEQKTNMRWIPTMSRLYPA